MIFKKHSEFWLFYINLNCNMSNEKKKKTKINIIVRAAYTLRWHFSLQVNGLDKKERKIFLKNWKNPWERKFTEPGQSQTRKACLVKRPTIFQQIKNVLGGKSLRRTAVQDPTESKVFLPTRIKQLTELVAFQRDNRIRDLLRPVKDN